MFCPDETLYADRIPLSISWPSPERPQTHNAAGISTTAPCLGAVPLSTAVLSRRPNAPDLLTFRLPPPLSTRPSPEL